MIEPLLLFAAMTILPFWGGILMSVLEGNGWPEFLTKQVEWIKSLDWRWDRRPKPPAPLFTSDALDKLLELYPDKGFQTGGIVAGGSLSGLINPNVGPDATIPSPSLAPSLGTPFWVNDTVGDENYYLIDKRAIQPKLDLKIDFDGLSDINRHYRMRCEYSTVF